MVTAALDPSDHEIVSLLGVIVVVPLGGIDAAETLIAEKARNTASINAVTILLSIHLSPLVSDFSPPMNPWGITYGGIAGHRKPYKNPGPLADTAFPRLPRPGLPWQGALYGRLAILTPPFIYFLRPPLRFF